MSFKYKANKKPLLNVGQNHFMFWAAAVSHIKLQKISNEKKLFFYPVIIKTVTNLNFKGQKGISYYLQGPSSKTLI